jgi:tRNA uridine 5-carboxymethylaminomethyl modification enzyme
VGPRYCPSIEDKITRFADKDSHQIFIEPEGLSTHEVYPNGISTSLPFDVQLAGAFIGYGKCARPGYAIEYEVREQKSHRAGSLFLRVKSTEPREEEAAQGLWPG